MRWGRVFKTLFWVQAGVNLIGALGPEISFDALWYHLPIARLITERGTWGTIPGGLLYTSATPRLVEFVNAGLLMVGGWLHLPSPELLPKLLSYGVGLACAGMIYKIARRYVASKYAWAAVTLWYSNLVVGWQSIVVYVDLHRTLLTLLAIWWIVDNWKEERVVAGAKAGICWGLAYSAKILAGIDLVFVSLAMLIARKRVAQVLVMAVVAGIIASVWGFLNWKQGYSFFYPFYGQKIYMPTGLGLRLSHLWSPLWQFFHPQLRTGPLVLVPLLIAGKAVWRKMPKELIVVSLAMFISWWFAPAIVTKGDGRYFLPTLAMMTVITAYIWANLKEWKAKIVIGIILFHGILGIGYRATANAKFVPYLLGQETKGEFLARRLNFAYGDWYDVDGWVEENLVEKKYLVIGVHNTYYLPGKHWDHESWVYTKNCYQYVLVQGEIKINSTWKVVHQVPKTRTTIYLDTACLKE